MLHLGQLCPMHPKGFALANALIACSTQSRHSIRGHQRISQGKNLLDVLCVKLLRNADGIYEVTAC